MASQQVKNLLVLAKQGHPQAIVALINRQLKLEGITATAAIDNSCLCILLESLSVPPSKPLVAAIRQGMVRLNPQQIYWVKVCGKRFVDEVSAWEYQFPLPLKQEAPSPRNQVSNAQTPDLFSGNQALTQPAQKTEPQSENADIENMSMCDSRYLPAQKMTLPQEEFWNVLGHVILQHQHGPETLN